MRKTRTAFSNPAIRAPTLPSRYRPTTAYARRCYQSAAAPLFIKARQGPDPAARLPRAASSRILSGHAGLLKSEDFMKRVVIAGALLAVVAGGGIAYQTLIAGSARSQTA